jgi:TonB family protein
MKSACRIRRILYASLAIVVTTSMPALAQAPAPGGMPHVKALYDDAEYDNALAALYDIDAATLSGAAANERTIYEALCLVALDRTSEAEAAVTRAIQADPLFSVGAEVSPRLRDLVARVREKLQPELVQAHYKRGKALYEKHDFAAAVNEFALVLKMTDSVDGRSPLPPELADIRTLAGDFRELAQHATRAAAPPAAVAASTPTPASSHANTPAAVVPPVAIRQDVPPWPVSLAQLLRNGGGTATATLELRIAADGHVQSAKVIHGIHPIFDQELIAAASKWKYQPGTIDGRPAEFTKELVVNVAVK